MAVFQYSRHTFVEQRTDDAGRAYLTDRIPFGYIALEDNTHHVVVAGDTLWSLAGKYFQTLERPAGLWWVIADFQPKPIHDPTIALVAGSVIVIPSVRTVVAQIFDESRRQETFA